MFFCNDAELALLLTNSVIKMEHKNTLSQTMSVLRDNGYTEDLNLLDEHL